jgi:hypothetical protein
LMADRCLSIPAAAIDVIESPTVDPIGPHEEQHS